MTDSLTVWVTGVGKPQGSKNAAPIYRGSVKKGTREFTGRVSVRESSADVKVWRYYVKQAAEQAKSEAGMRMPFDGPLSLTVTFYQFRPKKHFRTGKFSHVLRDDAPIAPATVPDLSKLIRATEDAITDAGVWIDDKNVVRLVADKAYVRDDVDSPRPGAVIVVRKILGHN
jgi:Holliday junction resolvase RusA-like endonuclease